MHVRTRVQEQDDWLVPLVLREREEERRWRRDIPIHGKRGCGEGVAARRRDV